MRARTTSTFRLIFAAGLLAGVALVWDEPPRADRAQAVVTTFTVNTTGDGSDDSPGDGTCLSGGGPLSPQAVGDCTLRAAIEESNALEGAQVIAFDPAINGSPIVISFSGGGGYLISGPVTIDGNGESATLIDACDGFPACEGISQLFAVSMGVGTDLARFQDVSIRGGRDGNGGGIFNLFGRVEIDHVTFDGNETPGSTGEGGAVNTAGVSMTIDFATFKNNTSTAYGGAIFAYGGTVTVRDSSFQNNTAVNGGAINSRFSTVTVQRGSFTGNQATDAGAAVYLESVEASVVVEDSVMSGGVANSGAAIANAGGTVMLRRSTVVGNNGAFAVGAFHGGGIVSAGTLTIEDSDLRNNKVYEGGAVYAQSGTVDIVRTAIVGNTAARGGGLLNNAATVSIANSTISGNEANSGSALMLGNPGTGTTKLSHVTVVDNHPPLVPQGGAILDQAIFMNGTSGATLTIKNSALKNPATGNCVLMANPPFTVTGSIASDGTCPGATVADPMLGPLLGWGKDAGYEPLASSPLIDAASDCTLISGGAVSDDQRTTVRPQDGDLDGVQVCDIGAIEVLGPNPRLVDQSSGSTFPFGARSTDHAGEHPFDTEAADDFAVPGPASWSIRRVVAEGSLEQSQFPQQAFNVRFYFDNGSSPGGVAAERLSQPYVQSGTEFSITLSTPVHLSPGLYWIAIQSVNEVNDQGWYWVTNTTQTNSPAAWRNTGGGFGTPCQDWGSRAATCNVLPGIPDQTFVIYGALDSDGDGCTDYEENGPNRNFGGERNPNDSWDFYNVTGDLAIDVADVVAILVQFGFGPQTPGYNAALDREADDMSKPWRTSPATGSNIEINIGDVVLNLQSFGHNCAGVP